MHSNRTVSFLIVLLELLTVLLEYIGFFCNMYFDYQGFVIYMAQIFFLALCSMISGTYYAQNYASIIGGSLECGPQKGYGEKRCEIQGGGQEMAVMVD